MSVSGNRVGVSEQMAEDFENQLNELAAMAAEPLHPDLMDWVEEHDLFGKMLRHPLVYDIGLTLPGQCNKAYARKKELLAEAQAAEDWARCVFIHERPHRLNALIEYMTGRDEYDNPLPLSQTTDQATLDLVADVWVDSENIAQHIEDWAALFGDCQFWLGAEFERAEFDALPDPIPAYRAGIDDGDWSWSTQRHTAEFFAARFQDTPLEVVEAPIPKDRCFGYLTRRGEAELLVRIEVQP